MTFLLIILLLLSSIFISTYIGFALYMFLKSNSGREVKKDPNYTPKVSLVICAYNEEKMIVEKIENVLQIDYPRDKLEIIVFDNGSEDRTFEVASSFKERGVRVLKLGGQNRGKSAGINEALKYVTGEIVKISDADVRYNKGILRKAMPYFADPSVGAVCASPVLSNPEQTAVTKIETSLHSFYHLFRGVESAIDSIIIGGGGFAFRRKLIEKLDESIGNDDIDLTVKVRKSGHRVLLLKDAYFYEYTPPTFRARWKQKIRRSTMIVQALIKHRGVMFKRKFGIYGGVIYPAEFFIHVLSPYILLTILGLSVCLLFLNFWVMISITMCVFVAGIVGGMLMSSFFNRKTQSAGPFSFVYMFLAFLEAQLVLLLGSLSLLWRKPYIWKSERGNEETIRWASAIKLDLNGAVVQ